MSLEHCEINFSRHFSSLTQALVQITRPLQAVLIMLSRQIFRVITPSRLNFRPFTPSLRIIISGTYHNIAPNLRPSGTCFLTLYPYISFCRTWDLATVKMGLPFITPIFSHALTVEHAFTPELFCNHAITLKIWPNYPNAPFPGEGG